MDGRFRPCHLDLAAETNAVERSERLEQGLAAAETDRLGHDSRTAAAFQVAPIANRQRFLQAGNLDRHAENAAYAPVSTILRKLFYFFDNSGDR